MIWRFPKLRRDERGAAIMELALAAPFLAAMLVGMTDISRAYSMKLQMEQAAQRAIEQIQQQSTSSTSYTSVGTEAQAGATAAGYSGSTAVVNYRLECNGTVVQQTTGAAITSSCSSGQTYARYVTVTVSNSYTPMFASSYFANLNSNGTVTVSGYAGTRVQ
jgi:Flp pilus assembly protein TadG